MQSLFITRKFALNSLDLESASKLSKHANIHNNSQPSAFNRVKVYYYEDAVNNFAGLHRDIPAIVGSFSLNKIIRKKNL